MHTTFTIQSVHGSKQTFVLTPDGTIDHVPCEKKEEAAESTRDRRKGAVDQR